MLIKRFFLLALCLILWLTGCEDGGTPTPTTVAPTPTTPADSAIETLATLLRGAGQTDVEIVEPREQEVFAASAWLMRVAKQTVFVYEYADEAERAAEAAKIAPDGYAFDGQPIAWSNQPHFWQNGRFLIQYIGTDIPTIQYLTAILGEPVTHAQEMGLTQLFNDSDIGFSLLLPSNWRVAPPQTTPLGQEYQLGPETAVTSHILVGKPDQPMTDWLRQLTCADCAVPEPRSLTLDTGIEVQTVKLKNSGEQAQDWYVFDHEPHRFALSINSEDGSQSLSAIIHTFTLAPETAVKPEETIPGVQAARQDLATQFGLDPYRFRIKQVTEATWPSTCLDIPRPGLACEPTPTPGYEITLRQGVQEFIYRGNSDGTLVLITFVPGM